MRNKGRRFRKRVSSSLGLLLLALSVAVPVLERADLSHAPVVESEHQPGSCPQPHDHTVCTQVGANHAAPRASVRTPHRGVVHRIAVAPAAASLKLLLDRRATPARDPPAV